MFKAMSDKKVFFPYLRDILEVSFDLYYTSKMRITVYTDIHYEINPSKASLRAFPNPAIPGSAEK